MRLLSIINENTEIEIKSYLNWVAENVRDKIISQYGSLENTCDIGADMVKEILSKESGFNASVINGEYYFKNDDWHEGHRWLLVVNGDHIFIVDPTVEQFEDNVDMVISIDDNDSGRYFVPN